MTAAKQGTPSRADILGALARGYCHEGNTHKQMDSDLLNRQADEVMSALAARREGYVEVPREPTPEMWGGLARDLMMAFEMCERHTPRNIFLHLENCGREIPQWLRDEAEMNHLDHSISKGTRCVLIYKAMLAASKSAGEK